MRLDNWKLIEHYENGALELHDLATDPGEQTDLAAREPARVAAMRGKLAAWRVAVGAQENVPNPDFDLRWANEIAATLDPSRIVPARTAEEMRPRLAGWREVLDAPNPKEVPDVPPAPGFLILPARDAVVHGTALKYESAPEKETLGFWKFEQDTATWSFELPAAARYQVEALIGCGSGSGGAEVEISAGGPPLSFEVQETGHFQNFVPRVIGSLRFKMGKNTITVTPRSKPGAAVMDLRQLTLTKVSD